MTLREFWEELPPEMCKDILEGLSVGAGLGILLLLVIGACVWRW